MTMKLRKQVSFSLFKITQSTIRKLRSSTLVCKTLVENFRTILEIPCTVLDVVIECIINMLHMQMFTAVSVTQICTAQSD